jgi:class 3 adenylate cyclase
VIIDLLSSVFEALTAALRSPGGEVLKFLNDGMLATLSFAEADRGETCRRALDAAMEAMQALAALNEARAAAGLPAVMVDIALHVGEVLYGNVGATDRLDFTVIGPAINEIARIEALCRAARPAGPDLGRIRRLHQRHRPPGGARSLQFARRPRSEGDFRVDGCQPSLIA